MNDPLPTPADLSPLLAAIRARTPARLFVGRVGASYSTSTWLQLRADHAFARDAVQQQIELTRDFPPDLLARTGLFQVATRASSRHEYLLRPDLGRSLADEARAEIARRCPSSPQIQILLGDGLSASALLAQAPALMTAIEAECLSRGWSLGQPFLVLRCRVGVLNDIGELLDPLVAVLLIGERPGLATAESLSAYLAYRPRSGHDDSRRNLISNIHSRGVPIPDAARRIATLAARMMTHATSGVSLKETLEPLAALDSTPLPMPSEDPSPP